MNPEEKRKRLLSGIDSLMTLLDIEAMFIVFEDTGTGIMKRGHCSVLITVLENVAMSILQADGSTPDISINTNLPRKRDN